MEGSIKEQKIQAMKNYKRAKFVYNFVLYSLTSIITCFFFSYPFWFPSMNNHFLSSLSNNISFFLNAKCFFVVGNLIVVILIGESRLKRSSYSSSSTSDIYDEYVARSRISSQHRTLNSNIEDKRHGKEALIYHHEEKKKEVRVRTSSSMPHKEQKKGMRACKSEVWGESEIVKSEKTKGKKEEQLYKSTVPDHEEKKKGMRACKSEVWGESEIVKSEKTKGKKEEQLYKSTVPDHEEKKKGMRACKSEVWGESEIVKMQKTKGKTEEQLYKSTVPDHEEKKKGMKACKSEVWGESEIVKMEKTKGKKEEQFYKSSMMSHGENKMGMRSCKSEVWGESSENVKREKTKGKEAEEQQLHIPREELNKRVEAFIARVNKQRLLEAKLVDHSRG